MVRVKEIIQWIDSWAPFHYAESWDNCGLQVGSPESRVRKILVALDPSSTVLAEAVALGAECIVTHHPLLLRPILAIQTDSWPGSVISRALIAGINIIAAHTNIDAAAVGTNTQLKQLLGMELDGPLEAEPNLSADQRYMGIGLVGKLPVPTTLELLAVKLSRSLDGRAVRVTGEPGKEIVRVAVCSGSGGSLISKAISAGADAFITGDIKYHDGRLAEESGLAIIDIGHFASEKLVLRPLADFLATQARNDGDELEIFVSRSEKDPFRVVAGTC